MNDIKKNFIYNLIYQILLLIIPFITVPYVSRVLLPEGVGIYSYTYSIVYYFMLIAMLGINNYGNRTIAKSRDDINKLSKNFFSIYSIQIIMTLLMLICYAVYILFFVDKYRTIAIIQGINLISVMIDINWFFFGLEKFKITVTRNAIIKILTLISIFTLVKNQNDLWIYTAIISVGALISQLALIPYLLKEIKFTKVSVNDIKVHIKPCILLFIPVIAISLYKVMDKIMLGKMANITEVGFYEQSEKIINIPMGVVTALGTIMLPRMSNLTTKGDNNLIKDYIEKSLNFMMFLAFPMCFGLIAVSSGFIPLFLGEDFTKSSILLYYLSFTIIFISFANVIRTHYLIPKEKDKIYIISVLGGAFINLAINILLIPAYQSIGACIGTVIAELFVMLYQTIAVKSELPLKKYIKNISQYFIKSLIMFFVIFWIKYLSIGEYLKIIMQIILGVAIYFGMNYVYIRSLVGKIVKHS